MPHSIIILLQKLDCLIALAQSLQMDALVSKLQQLRQAVQDLDTFILESSSEQEEAHTLLETIQTWATSRCAAQNVGGNCNGEAQGLINDIHQFI